jgi:hypothetical protein
LSRFRQKLRFGGLEAAGGCDRHARACDLDARQWAALFAHVVRRNI